MAEPAQTILPGTVLAGRYRVERRLGEGGMGSVFLVQHVHTDQQLALKILHAAVVKDALALERFRREARAPARINSDHVVQVTDADVAPELGGVPFLVMEWLRGNDLAELVRERGPVPPQDVVLFLRQTARALDKAHGLGIVHRDLKPENIFLTAREDGTPLIKLLDFGIAKLTGASSEVAQTGAATSTGQIFGTPLFMSPEQAKAEADKISPRTDIWALGLIAHKLLTGNDIWTARTLTHLIAQIAYEPMPVPSQRGSDFGPAYDAWFLRCCARDPSNRFASAGEAVTALADALRVVEVVPSTSVPGEPATASRPSMPGRRDSRDEAIAFAETAPVNSQKLLAEAVESLGMSEPRIVPGASTAPKSASRLRLAAAIAGIVFGGALGVWLALGGWPSPERSGDVSAQGAPVRTAETGAPVEPPGPVMVTPSAAAQALSAPSAPSAPSPSAPAVLDAAPQPPPEPVVKPVSPVAAARPGHGASARPSATAAPTPAPPVQAPPAATTAAPADEPDNPLSTRH